VKQKVALRDKKPRTQINVIFNDISCADENKTILKNPTSGLSRVYCILILPFIL
jgi:hypothetical protein